MLPLEFATGGQGNLVSRAIRSHKLWLFLGYVGVLALMARAYA